MTDPTNHRDHDEIVNRRPPGNAPRVGHRTATIGLITVAGAAAVGAVLYVASNAGAAPSNSTTKASSSSSSSLSSSGSSAWTCPKPGAGRHGGPGGPGPLGGPAGAGADGRITAVSSASLTVRDLFGESHTYKITSGTVVHAGPARTLKIASLSTGEHVRVRTSSSTSTAADIDVIPAAIDGAVTSVAGGSITVTDPSGFTRVIDTGSQTKYTVNSSSASRSKITTGAVVHAEGTVDANGTALDASSVDVRTSAPVKAAPPVGGAVCIRVFGPGGHGSGGPGRPGGPAGLPSGTVPSPGSAPSTGSSASTGSQPATPTPTSSR